MRRMLCACAGVLATLALGAGSAGATVYKAAGYGENNYGQLGNGTTTNSAEPVPVSSISEVVAVAAGGSHSLALLKSGHVMAWGNGGSGALGNGKTENSSVPVEVRELSEVTAIAAGGAFSLALLKSGKVMAWGENAYGQLGNGTTTNSDVPVEVKELSEVVGIAAGAHHALAVLKSGKAMAWGYNYSGQLGTGEKTNSDVPVEVKELSEVTAVSAGSEHSLALLSGGTVKAWGSNKSKQLGSGATTGCSREVGFSKEVETYGCILTPTTVEGVSGASEIVASEENSYALIGGGSVKAWGDNGGGQLGDGKSSGPEECSYKSEVEFGIVLTFSYGCGKTPNTVKELGEVAAISSDVALLSGGTLEKWGVTNTAVGGIAGVAGVSAQAGHTVTFGLPVPSVTGLSPSTGSVKGATSVTIKGTNLGEAPVKVKFGANEGEVVSTSETEVVAKSPAHVPGTVEVTVSVAGGTSAKTKADRFTYVPEGNLQWGRCKKVTTGTGHFKNSVCTESASESNYEWTAGVVKGGFTAKSVGTTTVTIEATGGAKLLCKGESAKGEYTGARQLANAALTLTGCEYTSTSAKCSSSGAGEGEVVTTSLEGVLGWVEKTTDKVGVDLFAPGEGAALLEAQCGTTSIAVKGSVIGDITPVNKMTSAYTLKFKQSKGKQAIEHFEGLSSDVLEMSVAGGAYGQAGLALESSTTNEEEVELNTVV